MGGRTRNRPARSVTERAAVLGIVPSALPDVRRRMTACFSSAPDPDPPWSWLGAARPDPPGRPWGNSGAAEHVRPDRNADDSWHPARMPAADLAECGPERAAGGLADRSAPLTARPRPGHGLRTCVAGPRFGCRPIMRAETSPRIRRASPCSGQPGSRPAALTSGNALRLRLGDGVAHRCQIVRVLAAETACDLQSCLVAGVGFEPT
jgi:hypothetical protein